MGALSPPGGVRLGLLPEGSQLGEVGAGLKDNDAPINPLPKDTRVGNPFASLIPFITGLAKEQQSVDPKPKRYLVAKGLPTLPVKLTERVWGLEYMDMEEFLPAPQAVRLAEQRKAPATLQDSLVGALDQFQAQCQQKSQRRVRT